MNAAHVVVVLAEGACDRFNAIDDALVDRVFRLEAIVDRHDVGQQIVAFG